MQAHKEQTSLSSEKRKVVILWEDCHKVNHAQGLGGVWEDVMIIQNVKMGSKRSSCHSGLSSGAPLGVIQGPAGCTWRTRASQFTVHRRRVLTLSSPTGTAMRSEQF